MPHDLRLMLLLIFAVSLTRGDVEHFSGYWYHSTEVKYTGAIATFDVYSFPNLKKGKANGGTIWVMDFSLKTIIQSGWQIAPDIYGDSKTHFYVDWTTDGNDGCVNLKCDGFVPVHSPTITPGDILEPSNGQMNITLKIYKSKEKGDWWLYLGKDINSLSPVGYWPKSLLTKLEDRAGYVAWGGWAISDNGVISPPIGNGQWPRSDSAASFRNVQLVDMSGRGSDPVVDNLHAFPREKCYQTGVFRLNVQGNMFYYGGPGGNNCNLPLYL